MTLSTACRALRARGPVTLLLLAAGLGSCQSAEQNPIGGETHFLMCGADKDCRQLSDEHICLDHQCRLPSTISVPTTQDAAPPANAQDAAPPRDDDDAGPAADPVDAGACPRGDVAASEVVILGDSFFATTHEIAAQLQQLATTAGSRPEDEPYRDYSRFMDNALAFMGNGIAEQYVQAKAEGEVRAVIMNGGGADALLGTCDTIDAECPVVVAAATAAEELLGQMSDDGVEDIVYVFYPDARGEATRSKVDALRPLVRDICAAAPTPCHWLDLRPSFEGNYDTFIAADGLNPTTAGAAATASEIWNVMVQHCIAQ